MNNIDRENFLKQKPTYACILRNNFHTVGCSHKGWRAEELQVALDGAKRSQELQLHLLNTEGKSDYCNQD